MTSSIPRSRLLLSFTVNVAGIGLGHCGEAHLQSGAARCAFDFGSVVQNPLDVLKYTIGFCQRAARGHDVVEHETAFVHLRQQIGAQALVGEPCPQRPARRQPMPESRIAARDQFSERVVPVAGLGVNRSPVLERALTGCTSALVSRSKPRPRPGVKVSASKSEVSSATVMVMARARKKLPVTPVTEISGRKTTTGVIVEPIRGTVISCNAFATASTRVSPLNRDGERCFRQRRSHRRSPARSPRPGRQASSD